MTIEKVFLRTEYNYDMNKATLETAVHCQDETKTKQSMAEECDINVIWSRYVKTGELPLNNRKAPMYGDFTNIPTYQDALEAVREAGATFNMMPAEVRARFQNDPAEFVEYCSNEANREQLKLWGLTIPKTPTEGTGSLPGGPKEGLGPPSPITASSKLGEAEKPANKEVKT